MLCELRWQSRPQEQSGSLETAHDFVLRRGRARNWNEQRTFDKVNTVDPTLKNKGFHYNHVESVKHDKKCPPTMVSCAKCTSICSPLLPCGINAP